ncbi:MAG: HEPN domain-containing protein [Verrucomicrobia bacterium]|nr:HEPN domain-containing protein [Verrucomicrobiota bacterium]
MKPLTRDWVDKAEGDYLVASQIMRRKSQRVFDAACFHCQQAVEKYFKARLIEAGMGFPKTHDLVQLLKLLQAVEPLWMTYEPPAKTLTTYAVTLRYPGEGATLAEAKTALKHCRSIRAEVRRSLGLKAK